MARIDEYLNEADLIQKSSEHDYDDALIIKSMITDYYSQKSLSPNVTTREILTGIEEHHAGFLGEVGAEIGKFFGGMGKGALEPIIEMIRDLIEDTSEMIKEIIYYAKKELEEVLDTTIDKLDKSARELLEQVMQMEVLMGSIAESIVDDFSIELVIIMARANILAYDTIKSLPFTKRDPRLVYIAPFILRYNSVDFDSAPISVFGNFLLKYREIEINGFPVEIVSKSNNEISFLIPPQIIELINIEPSGTFHAVLRGRPRFSLAGLWGKQSDSHQIKLNVLPKVDIATTVEIWPEFDQTVRGVHMVQGGTEKTKNDNKTVHKEKFLPDEIFNIPGSQIDYYRKVSAHWHQNKSSKLKSVKYISGRKGIRVSYWLDGDGSGIFKPFEAKAWFKFAYDLFYSYPDRNQAGDSQIFTDDTEESYDETAKQITRVFKYPDFQKYTDNEDISQLRWKYRVLIQTLTGLSSENAPLGVENEIIVSSEIKATPAVNSSINNRAELTLVMNVDKILNTPAF